MPRYVGRRGDHDQRRPTGLCSVCGEIIVSTADGSFESTYPDGRVFTFHGRCEQLWQALQARASVVR